MLKKLKHLDRILSLYDDEHYIKYSNNPYTFGTFTYTTEAMVSFKYNFCLAKFLRSMIHEIAPYYITMDTQLFDSPELYACFDEDVNAGDCEELQSYIDEVFVSYLNNPYLKFAEGVFECCDIETIYYGTGFGLEYISDYAEGDYPYNFTEDERREYEDTLAKVLPVFGGILVNAESSLLYCEDVEIIFLYCGKALWLNVLLENSCLYDNYTCRLIDKCKDFIENAYASVWGGELIKEYDGVYYIAFKLINGDEEVNPFNLGLRYLIGLTGLRMIYLQLKREGIL